MHVGDVLFYRGGQVYLYGLCDPRSDRVFYVGQSTSPKERLKQHITHSLSGLHRTRAQDQILALCELGAVPYMRILAIADTKSVANAMELALIDEYGTQLLNSAETRWASKRDWHARQRALPVEEKIRIIVKLQKRQKFINEGKIALGLPPIPMRVWGEE